MRILRNLRDMTGYRMQARDGEEIGKLEEIYFDDQDWCVRYFVVSTGSWLSGKTVLMTPAVINGIDDEDEYMAVDLDRKRIENCPPLPDKQPVSLRYEKEYYDYYGWKPYWSGDPRFEAEPSNLPPGQSLENTEPKNLHLQSSDDVTGYHIHAMDGELGHVEDFVLEDPAWMLRYLIADTRNWLPGKKVLISPGWISYVDWIARYVTVNLSREVIKTAPAYHPSDIISQDYELDLFKHYGM